MAVGDITYGSAVVFNAARTRQQRMAVIDDTHFILAYFEDGANNGEVRIGTITGTSVSFGSVYQFHAGAVASIDVTILDSTHFALSWSDAGGGDGGAIVGVISSGDVVAFGSEVTFNPTAPAFVNIVATDSTHFTIAYQDTGGGDNNGHTRSAVVTGDAIVFGSEDTFNAATTTQINLDVLDSTHIAISYQDQGNSNKGTSIVGTLASDDEMTFGSEVVFDDSAPTYVSVAALDATHFITTFKDAGDGFVNSYAAVVSSGDTITFGLQYTVDTDDCYDIYSTKLNSTQFLIVYRNLTNVEGIVKIGTVVSDDEISFGSDYPFLLTVVAGTNIIALSETIIAVSYNVLNTNALTIIGEIEAPTGTNMQINIGDGWKDISAIQINIGDSWKDVTKVQINIGDTWKDVF